MSSARAPTYWSCLAGCHALSTCRYYSAYYYYRWWLKEDKPPTPDDFHEHALKELREWKDCVAAMSVPDCVRAYRPQQLIKGLYAEFLPVRTC